MRMNKRALVLGVIKATFAVSVTYVLFLGFLLSISSPDVSPLDDSAEAEPAIGWILLPLFLVISVLAVSLMSGIVFVKDRWIARVTAIIVASLALLSLASGLIAVLRNGLHSGILTYVKFLILPMSIAVMIVLVFSSLCHDWGRMLRGRINMRSATQ